MGLLSSYLMRTIVVSTALVLTVLLSLAALFEFIGQLEDVKGSYGIPQALMYSLLRLPQLSFEMLPIAVLIGSLLGLGGLANNSELVVMRSAGLSLGRLAAMVAWSGLALTIFTALIGEFIGPPLDIQGCEQTIPWADWMAWSGTLTRQCLVLLTRGSRSNTRRWTNWESPKDERNR